jgi:uncharacterized membrane protein YgcG
MKRLVAILLAASLSLQAAGCTTVSAPALPVGAAPARGTAVETVTLDGAPARPGTRVTRVDPPPAPSPSEFWGGQGGGLLVGVGLVAVIVLGILIGGRDSSSGGTGTGGAGTGGTGTGGTGGTAGAGGATVAF